METFADYILSEEDLYQKIEIMRYLSKKKSIETHKPEVFFDESVIFKTEIARMFLETTDICKNDNIDSNVVLTACLLCDCKKVIDMQNSDVLYSYAKEGADYLRGLGFSKRFAKICEEVNRYSGSNPREKESDILELVYQFGGMILDRPERIGLKPEEALAILRYNNLKDVHNRYIEIFCDFIHMSINDILKLKEDIFEKQNNNNRSLFSEKTKEKYSGKAE